MKKFKIVLASCIMVAMVLSLFTACGGTTKSNDVVILFTGSSECALDHNIGFDGVAGYKQQMQNENSGVALVDCGNFASGETIGTVSQGECAIDPMNAVGYDYIVPNEKDFIYGVDQLATLLGELDAQSLGCNFKYTGSGENKFKDMQPYGIKQVGDKKIGFVGVVFPQTIEYGYYSYFQEDGKTVYDFCGSSKTDLYNTVQNSVDKCKAEGADYVFLMSSLDIQNNKDYQNEISCKELANNTTNVTAILNSYLPDESQAKNKSGENVEIISLSDHLYSLGKVTISETGDVTTDLVYDRQIDYKDAKVAQIIEQEYTEMSNITETTIATSNVELTCDDEKGNRVIEYHETNMGDLCADAYRKIADADVAIVNGGGIRSGIEAGTVTYADVFRVYPYGNTQCTVKATGQQILDALEVSAYYVKKDVTEEDAQSIKSGSVLQVSGMKYTIDTSIPSTVVFDDEGVLVSTGANRRVSDVSVLKKGTTDEYEAIDVSKEYTVSSNNFILKNGALGYSVFRDCDFVDSSSVPDYELLADYIKTANLNLYENKSGLGRITIK